MLMQLKRSCARTFVLGGSCTVVLVLGMAGSVLAAGSGYGSSEPSTSAPPPTGFSSVVIAQTVGSEGGTITAPSSGGTVTISVPPGASESPLQVAITKGSRSTVKKDLSSALKKYKVVAEFGVELKQGPSSASASKSLTVTFKGKKIAKGDIIVVYNDATGKFVKVTATVKKGEVAVHLKAGESIAVLAPPKKK